MTTIRIATVSDASNLAVFAATTFRETFSEQNTAEDIEIHCLSSYSATIQSAEISNPEYVTLLVENNKQLVGFAQLRWGKCPDCVPSTSPGEIQRLYIDKSFHGKGVAHNLMSSCLEILRARGTDTAWLGVWEKNPRALSFYRKFNFQEVGSHIFTLGRDAQKDIIMLRPVNNTISLL